MLVIKTHSSKLLTSTLLALLLFLAHTGYGQEPDKKMQSSRLAGQTTERDDGSFNIMSLEELATIKIIIESAARHPQAIG